MRNLDEIKNVQDLEGEALGCISFGDQYVRFVFNGPQITCFSGPSVQFGALTVRFPEPGSRDLFCVLLGQTVISAVLDESRAIVLTFFIGKLQIPLDVVNKSEGYAASFEVVGTGVTQYFGNTRAGDQPNTE